MTCTKSPDVVEEPYVPRPGQRTTQEESSWPWEGIPVLGFRMVENSTILLGLPRSATIQTAWGANASPVESAKPTRRNSTWIMSIGEAMTRLRKACR